MPNSTSEQRAEAGNGSERPPTFNHPCRFTSLDDLKGKDRRDYQKVRAAVLAAGRFSVWDASDAVMARQLTTLCRDQSLIIDTASVSFPWTLVRERTTPLSTLALDASDNGQATQEPKP